MNRRGFEFDLVRLPGPMPVWSAAVDARQWRAACERVREEGGRLVALWGADRTGGGTATVCVALANAAGLIVLRLPVAGAAFPDVSDLFPAANRMQRAVRDLLGLAAEGAADSRQWLRHAAWGEGEFPLRRDFSSRRGPYHESSRDPTAGEPAAPLVTAGAAPPLDAYPFVRVEGEAVHEIPVGPVHAGTIEPGHFRFSVVGEGVLRLEERLGYKHKGIEKCFEALSLADGARLAGRVSGDSTVAYAWAYAMAVESAAGVAPPSRAQWLRALLLERERVGQHLWDLGFLGNDAGFAFGLAQFSRLREDLLRTNAAVFGHRYLMDTVVPGGVARELPPEDMRRLREEIAWLAREVKTLKSIYDEHAGLQDRFIGCGRVPPRLADRVGLTGCAGRASGQAWDLRAQFPCVPYNELDLVMATHRNGDVAARVTVRFEETFESLRISRLMLERLPFGDLAAPVPVPPPGAFGVGWVEGWRGEVLVALESGEAGAIARCHPHDPSWQNWPALEYAVIGNIVPDFPLINKSFNLSYSGHDL
ncbi:MAG: NADH-quinone oxidoreductase subunit C [Burkholderiales bacterium]|nr:NADH-quinone oxidoreductase subunit C [Burkholderiales bacterium]